MTDRQHDRFHRAAVTTLKAAALLIVCAVLFTWAWGAIAVDLFGLPKAEFKHALALEAAVAGFAVLAVWAGRIGRRRGTLAGGDTA